VDNGAGMQDGNYLLKKYPQSVLQIGLYMVGGLEDVLAGRLDDNIKKLGQWIIETNRPVFLRIGYEFDLPDNHYDPHLYVKAYRYIVDKFKEMKVDNVAYVWHSFGYIHPDKPLLNWYPGDDYVDWIGVSFFDPYNTGNMRMIGHLAKEHQKPFMIAEATPHGLSTIDGEKVWNIWYKRFFNVIEQNDVKAACYINAYWDIQPMWHQKGWGDARIQNHSYIEEQWLKHIREQGEQE
jgi:beta-mannanase